jgi:UDP-arabinose 4-epimerase
MGSDARYILVTGGAGYIGSHTCKALASAGFVPITYDNLCRGHAWMVRWGPMERGDIADNDRLTQIIKQYRPLATLHFAGYGYVAESMQLPQLYIRNNIVNTYLMMETLREAGMTRIIFSSSCAIYGGVHNQRIDENAEQKPLNTYGFSKLAIERMLSDYSRAHHFRSISLRYFNAAGADPEGELGEFHDPEPHFIPNVLRVASGREPFVQINGNDHPTPDGTCVRDFTHVSDIASAHVSALQRLLCEDLVGAYNLGSGNGYSLRQIVDIAKRVTGRSIPVEIGPKRIGDPPYAVANASLAQTALGWRPMYCDIEQTIEHAWRWSCINDERHLESHS